jgi:molybdate transport system substrate-binding protein
VAGKLALAKSVEEALKRVADGESDLCVMLASEILPAKGVQYAGPFPAPYASYVSFAAAAGPDSRAIEAGNRFIATLRAPTSAKAYEAKGMELKARH